MTIHHIQHYVYGTTRNFIAGASLYYAIERQKYLEIPLTILLPSIYAGYHVFKNKEHIIQRLFY